MPRIVLFRTPTPNDNYVSEFEAKGYTVTSISALDDSLNPSALVPYLDPERWGGVIITSRRAAEAWVLAAKQNDITQDWSKIPFYAPGPTVGSVLSSLSATLPTSEPIQDISAAALVPKILSNETSKPLLLLVGDRSMPTIPEALLASRRPFERVQVYSTCEAETLAPEIAKLKLDKGDWVAFFSPSSSEYVRRHLDISSVKVAVIGETTEKAVGKVDAVAQRPDAKGLAEAVVEADQRLEQGQ